jgi:hypothetical protein
MRETGDFWRNSGFHLTRRNESGHLEVTPDLIRAYLFRPEVAPVEESGPAELALHAALVEDPLRPVSEPEIDAITDADTGDNYRVVLKFRDRMVKAGTLERAYLDLFRAGGSIDVPPLFIDHLAHAIARNMLDAETNAFTLRAAELLFREQVVTIIEGAIILADGETVDLRRERKETGHFSLLEIAQAPEAANEGVEIEVLSEDNAADYGDRSERFDMALDITFPRPGLDAFARVLALWVRHFLGADVEVQPTQQITDERWVWHIGLDREATDLLNDLYNGRTVSEERNAQLLSLFRMTFRDASAMRADIAGRPVYLGLCQSASGRLALKPQNLLVNLPLASPV